MSGWLAALVERLGGRSRDELELPPGASVDRDLAYGPESAQRLDLYRPAEPVAPPLIVVVGGGAWALGDKSTATTVANKVAHWLPAGRAVASIGYRRLPAADPVEQAGDIAHAVAFLQRRLAADAMQPRDIVLIGHSSGAHLVALLAADVSWAAAEGVEPWLGSILIDSAALDVVCLMSGPHLPLHDRAFGSSEAAWEKASPLHRLSGTPAPMLLVHSTRRPFAGEQAQAFAAAVAERGGQAEVVALDLTHVGLNAELGSDPDYTGRVDAFLDALVAGCDAPSASPGP
jgi:acetyl esterase/lipase